MAKELLINVSEGEECRIALLENGKLEELYMERTSSALHVGNIYKGKVTNVEPSIQAAFVDFGLGRNGFLHISDLMPTYFGRGGEDIHESVGKKMARRDRPPIQRCLRRGDEIVVQIIKEGIGTKGPTLSTYLSIPGQILVMMPGMEKMGVSKKIEDEQERKRLRTILDGLKPPKDCGFIIRTSGIGRTKTEIDRDLKYLARLWETLQKKEQSGPGPMMLYAEGDLVTRTVRDIFSTDIDRIIIDSKDVAKKVKEVIKITSPRTKNKVEVYDEPIPLFHKYNIEREIELMYSRHVPLPSGGSLVIDSTEAVVAIDVNSGKFRDHSDAETTAFKTDMEAADEIPRQLKLRDLGGVIICDFIDLRFDRHRRELEHKLHENFKRDRAKTKVLRMSQFGIIELTRQRMRPSLKRSIYFDCPHCKGAGLVKTPESMSLDVMRRVAIAAHDERVVRAELHVNPSVAFYLQNKKRASLAALEEETGKRILIHADAALALDEVRWTLADARDGMVILESLGMVPPTQQNQQQHGHRHQQGGGRGDRRDRRDERRPRDQRGQQNNRGGGRRDEPRDEPEEGVRFDIDAEEEAQPAPMLSEESAPSGLADAPQPIGEDTPADVATESIASDEPVEGGEERGEATTAVDDEEQSESDEGGQDDRAESRDQPDDRQQNRDYRDDEQGGRRRRRRRGRRGRGGGNGGGDNRTENRTDNRNDNRGENRNDNRNQGNRYPAMLENNGDQDVEVIDDEEEAQPAPKPQRQPQNQNRRQPQQQPKAPAAEAPAPVPAAPDDPYADYEEDDGPSPGNELHPPKRPEPQKSFNNRRGGGRGNNQNRGGRNKQGGRRGGQMKVGVGFGGSYYENQGNVAAGGPGNFNPQRRYPNDPRRGPAPQNQPQRTPPRSQNESQQGAPAPQPPRNVEPPAPVVKTGSTDKHLGDDLPIDPQPLSRPRSYRDLDAIPDDFD